MFRGVMSVLTVAGVLASGCTVEYKSSEDDGGGESSAPESIPEEERLGHSDFHDTVLFTGGESATMDGGWRHESCDEVDAEGALAEAGCEYAIELYFAAHEEGTQYSLLLLAAPAGTQNEGVQEFTADVGDPANVTFGNDTAMEDSVDEAQALSPMSEGFALVAVASTTNEDVDVDEQVDIVSSNMSETLRNLDHEH